MEPSQRFEKFFDELKDIFKNRLIEKGIKEDPLITPVEYRGFAIDLPKSEHIYHGSSYEIICNRTSTWCKIKGDLIVDTKLENIKRRDLESAECKIIETHIHSSRNKEKVMHGKEEEKEESHIHFICPDKDRIDTYKLVHFLKDF